MTMKRNGVTLIEMSIGLVIAVLIVGALHSLMSTGLKSSVKGSSHLSNIQVASIITSYLERDFVNAVEVTTPTGDEIQLKVADDVTAGGIVLENVVYECMPSINRFSRKKALDGSPVTPIEHDFCSGFSVDKVGNQPVFSKISLPGGRVGFVVKFQIATAKKTEPFEVERVFVCGNGLRKTSFAEWDWLR